MNFDECFDFLLKQKTALIKKYPNLEYKFVDVFFPKFKKHIPFLPIGCFRDFELYTSDQTPEKTFLSSGSTQSVRARHMFSANRLKDYAFYASKGFSDFLNFHHIAHSAIISLIPPPTEWADSSLSAMLHMFSTGGFKVYWSDTSRFLPILKSLSPNSNVVIFGTTFHHLQLIQAFENSISDLQACFQYLNISIIDTGGTKGKTQAFSLDETKKIFKSFYGGSSNSPQTQTNGSSDKIKFFSEYGMCELSSQAWSKSADHNGVFIANETLLPLVIDLNSHVLCAKKKIGFLGFIDALNYESYPAIITEDLGYIISDHARAFKLVGRAPDASIKGCSLNIKNFQFLNHSDSNLRKHRKKQVSVMFDDVTSGKKKFFYYLEKFLQKKYWTDWDICDLKLSLSSLEVFFQNQKKSSQKICFYCASDDDCECKSILAYRDIFSDKDILIIAAANTPMSFMYPLILAAQNGAQSITLKIPTIRSNDPLSKKTRAQIFDLYRILQLPFAKTKFFLSTSRSLGNDFDNYHCIFAFGTNETIEIIKAKVSSKTQVLGFGDIKNAFIVNTQKHSPMFLTQICSAWYGRGCVTPVCLFVEPQINQEYLKEFFELFSTAMKQRLKAFKNTQFHAHTLLNLQSQLKQHKIDLKHVLRSEFAVMVNLSDCLNQMISNLSLDFSVGGCGWIFVLPNTMMHYFGELSFDSVFPTISDFSKKLAPETNHDSDSIVSSIRH